MDRHVQKHGFRRLTSSSAEPAINENGLQIGDACGCQCWRQIERDQPGARFADIVVRYVVNVL